MTASFDFVNGAPAMRPEIERRTDESTSAKEESVTEGPDAAALIGVGDVPEGSREGWEAHSGLWLYRDRTVALLRRYLRLSIEVGRLPSLVGREFFRTRVTLYSTSTFEDSVIFVHDVERSLEALDEIDRALIAKIVLEEYTHEEAARLLGYGYRTVARRFPEALDLVSEIFLERKILERLPVPEARRAETCQEGKIDEFPVSR